MHTVQVQATDSLGQVVDSVPATLRVDRSAPRVRVRARGSVITVRVLDGDRGQVSGVRAGSVRVSFGDGGSGHGRLRFKHSYARAGSYTIVVSASDVAGNKATIHTRVRVA